MSSEPLHIRDREHAPELARDLATLREALRTSTAMAQAYREALLEWLHARGEAQIEQEGFDTLVLRDVVGSYDWDIAAIARDGHLDELVEAGVLTVQTGAYDEYVAAHGPLELKARFARPQYHEELRFEKPPPRQPPASRAT